MEYSHRYRAYPTDEVAEGLERRLDVHRQLYNHVRWNYENSPEYDQNNKLTEWKRKWAVFGELHSKAAQTTVARFHRNLSNLRTEYHVTADADGTTVKAATEHEAIDLAVLGPLLDSTVIERQRKKELNAQFDWLDEQL